MAWLALLVALGTAGAFFSGTTLEGFATDGGSGPGLLQQSLAPAELRSAASTTGVERVGAASDEMKQRIARLEDLFPQGLGELETMRKAYREATSERDQAVQLYRQTLADTAMLVVDEVDDLLALAARQIGARIDAAAPLALVEAARLRAARRESPALVPVLNALDADLVALRAIAERSPIDVADRLLRLVANLDALPFESTPIDAGAMAKAAHAESAAAVPSDAATAGISPGAADSTAASGDWWAKFKARSSELVDLERARGDAGELLKVTRIGESDASTLPPPARYFIVENLRLRLLGARLSLLLRDDAGFEADRALAAQWLAEHFDQQAPAVAAASKTLQDLAGWRQAAGTPSVERSLTAVALVRKRLDTAPERTVEPADRSGAPK